MATSFTIYKLQPLFYYTFKVNNGNIKLLFINIFNVINKILFNL